MDTNTIQNSLLLNQELSKDGNDMFSRNLIVFVDDLIREYAIHKGDYYSLFANRIPPSVQKVFLSLLITPSIFEEFNATPEGVQAALDEYQDDMQYLINERLNEVYIEDMEEMGFHLKQCSNGDSYMERR